MAGYVHLPLLRFPHDDARAFRLCPPHRRQRDPHARRRCRRGRQIRPSGHANGHGRGTPSQDIEADAIPLFKKCLVDVRVTLPDGHQWCAWRDLSPIEFEDLHTLAYAWLAEDDSRREAFLQAELRLSHTYLLVKSLPIGHAHADEVLFHQRVRKQISKTKPGAKRNKGLEEVVRDLVDDHVESEGVVDIFKLAGIPHPDISILDDSFLQTFKDRPLVDLRLKLLQRLLADELTRRAAKNLAKTHLFYLASSTSLLTIDDFFVEERLIGFERFDEQLRRARLNRAVKINAEVPVFADKLL